MRTRWMDRTIRESIAVGVVVFVGYFVAAGQIGVGWDEGFTFDRMHLLERWFGEWPRIKHFSSLFSRETLDQYWRFSKAEPDGHGPFYCLLCLAGYKLTNAFLEPAVCYRIGSIVLFSFTAACVYSTLRRRFDAWLALATVGMLATIPRVVPELSFALIDGPLFSLAMLTWCAFVRAEAVFDEPTTLRTSGWTRAIPFGICIGLAMSTKITGWLLIGPYIGWAILRRRGFATVVTGLLVGSVVCLFLNVGWWPDPVAGVIEFWRSNLTREKTISIGIQFLGTRYPFSLPWYNTLVWTAVANPVMMTLLGLIGVSIAVWRWRRDDLGLLLLLNWLLLIVVRALPKAPGHDGTRQIIISFGFLALLAGYALVRIAARGQWQAKFAGLLAIAAVVESSVALVRYHPLELSYYSPAVGGLPGATRLGFEPTYFWDALTPDVLDWLNDPARASGWVLFRNNPKSFDYMKSWGKIRFEHRPQFNENPPPIFRTPPTWLVIQHRPGIFTKADDWLIANRKPAFEKQLFGVPLISIYPGADFEIAQRAVAGSR